MRIEIRNDSVLIDGYVNAVERESRPVITEKGRMVEKVAAGTFKKAIERAEEVKILLDHDESRILGSTKTNLKLTEDAIGLRAIAEITDSEVIEKAKDGKLRGWSFGMYVNEDSIEERADGLPLRTLTDIDLFEVSIIDEKMRPCYSATSIEARAEGEEKAAETRAFENKSIIEVFKKDEKIDYSDFEERINSLKK